MQANPEKFKAIGVVKMNHDMNLTIKVSNTQIYCEDVVKLIFHTFILSNFNYCPLAWHFCSLSNSKKLETIQEHALRSVYADLNILAKS